MTFISLFSGIGGFDLGFKTAGMDCVARVEIDKNCRDLLSKRFPGAEVFEDVREVGKRNLPATNLVCGGFPCQDLSVAGKRAGLAGERSGLWYEFARIIDELETGWVIIENVPGLLSSNRGADFAVIVRWLADRGYGVAWRVLDSRYFGVPQRRRRVFIVGSFGSGRAAEILFESESGAWDTAKGRKERQGVAGAIENGATSTLRGFGHGWGGQHNDTNAVMVFQDVSPSVNVSSTRCDPDRRVMIFGGNNTLGEIAISTAINAHPSGRYDFKSETFVWDAVQITSKTNKSQPKIDKSFTVNSGNIRMTGVRRLTPTECERLQGFPDGWTEGFLDSTRYRMLGNAVTVPVIEWIGKRIMEASK